MFSQFFRKNSTEILTGAGVFAFGAAIFLVARATRKAEKDGIFEESENMPPKEKALTLAKVYAPALGAYVVGVGFVLAARSSSNTKITAMTALVAATENRLGHWQEKSREVLGEKTHEKVRKAAAFPVYEFPPDMAATEKTLFYDVYCGRYFVYGTLEDVRAQINEANDMLLREGVLTLNDLYFDFSLPPVSFGNEVGWELDDGLIEVRFDSHLYKDRPVVSIQFINEPGVLR